MCVAASCSPNSRLLLIIIDNWKSIAMVFSASPRVFAVMVAECIVHLLEKCLSDWIHKMISVDGAVFQSQLLATLILLY